MQTHLRPMSLGEILDRTAQLYRTNFMLLAGIAAVYAGVLLVLNLAQIGLQELLLHLHMAAQLPWVTLVFVLLIFPVMVVCAGAAVAANNRAVAWLNLDQPATIRAAYRSILPRLGRYLWLMTIVFFFVYIPFVLLFTGYFVFLFAYGGRKGMFASGGANADPQAAIVLGLVTLGFLVLALGATVYAVLMTLRYALAVPASVVEDLKARKAIRRSIELTKGSRGRIFLLLLLIFVIEIGLVAITQVFFMVAMFTAAKHHAEVPVWIQILQQIVGFLTNSFIGPMYATGLTLFYYDQRIRKEGFDIEWMMEAAGMTAPALNPTSEPIAAPPQFEQETPTASVENFTASPIDPTPGPNPPQHPGEADPPPD
ncbi:MAG: glycerophosphoryl diester phosphodiesterase membrane domain-containing protein [Terracidiphilus sp.]|nr:glycerophosphoryl diester phosphodiesterase membrane domain-containing protein [Terracidiphilus sp.]